MAKRKRAVSAEPSDSRKKPLDVTPRVLREKAEEVRRVAAIIESYAEMMDEFEIAGFRVLVGNFDQAIEILKGWIGTQIRSRVIAEAESKGLDIEVAIKKGA